MGRGHLPLTHSRLTSAGFIGRPPKMDSRERMSGGTDAQRGMPEKSVGHDGEREKFPPTNIWSDGGLIIHSQLWILLRP